MGKTTETSLNFAAGQSSLEQLAGAQPILWNFLPGPENSLRIRPLITPWDEFPAAPDGNPVVGIQVFGEYVVYVAQDATTGVRKLWAWLGEDNVVALSDATAATQLDGALRPVFAQDHSSLFVTGGGAPQTWTGAGLTARLGGSPPASTHCAVIAQRLVLSPYDVSGEFVWTDPGDGNHATFPALNFAEAEAAPDKLVALHANTNEVFTFGTSTLQYFTPDPNTAFSTGRALTVGCLAPYSVIATEDAFAWLDDKHRFLISDGRSFEVLSGPGMARSVSQLATVSDCWGARVVIDAYDLLLWCFPTEGRALWYDRTTKKWGEWFSNDGSDFVPFAATSYCYWPARNLHLIGLSDGNIAVLTFDATTELGENVRAVSRTGFSDKDTLNRKLCQQVQLVMKRGATDPADDAPTVDLSYRDTLGAFKPAVSLSLGAGDYCPIAETFALGVYRLRQWQLDYSGDAEFVLTAAKETVEMSES